jgi:amino acid adenylation domain-containing protein
MNTKKEENNLACRFMASAHDYPQRVALEVNNSEYTYESLSGIVGALRNIIINLEGHHNKYISILSNRSLTSYAAILATLCSGRAYIPLHPDVPPERSLKMLKSSAATIMIVGAECKDAFIELLSVIDNKTVFITVGFDENEKLFGKYPLHSFLNIKDIESLNCCLKIDPVSNDDLAYLLFTSGSTGDPKGVPVNHKNISEYINYIIQRYNVNENDRFSQMFELVFDPSIHDMFVCWGKGGCLCVPKPSDLLLPLNFIKRSKITMWFSVPSVAMFIDNYGRLEPNIFPTIRYSLFSGEALPENLARKWSKSASNSKVVNLYGPTEATITILEYLWENGKEAIFSDNGIVPIGVVYKGQKAVIIDDEGSIVTQGVEGELCLSGTQVTKGYLNDHPQTELQFVTLPDLGNHTWYKTGDLVKQDINGCVYYLGRIDNQVKIQGHRIELGEVDKVVREGAGSQMVTSIAWPLRNNVAVGIVSIVCKANSSTELKILEYCKSVLPKIMVPKKIYFVDTMPLNINGKTDRNKIKEMLENGTL